MSITQDGRMMAITTPLGKDFLLVNKLSAVEAVSELFAFDVELFHEEDEAGDKPTIIAPKDILGKEAGVAVMQRDGTVRLFNGIISHFSQGNRDRRFSQYYATIVPHVWLLTQRAQSRIFQNKSVPDILKKVFSGFNVDYELQGTFEPRNYCVQYRETDFAFASRLMEDEGIYYYFKHTPDGHKMVVANTPQSHIDCPGKFKIPFFLDVSSNEGFVGAVASWRIDYRVQTGKMTLWDSNFEVPQKHLEAEKPARPDIKADGNLEIYDYPGNYGKRFDGVSSGGGDQPAQIQKLFTDNKRTTSVRMEEIDAQYKVAHGMSDCCSLTAGCKFELEDHPNEEFNGKYTLLSVAHEMEQSPGYYSEEDVADAYKNSFSCIPEKVPFRPLQRTPKPTVRGSQTAFVVGPSGEEIYTDKYGRVKVQFQWDREGQNNASSSCWVRVAQSWAGKKWGMIFIPRIGMEVIVDFLEGDPDRPIINGSVYNAETMPPYALPGEKTKMTIKSDSSQGGQGFNELRFEDKKGKEQIFIHGEKDLDTRIKNDSMEWIGNNKNLIVNSNQLEKVGGDKHLQILGDQIEKIKGTVSLNVEQDIQEKVKQNYALDAGQEIHLKAGMKVIIEAGTQISLKVGGNFIDISSAGVSIKGTMVNINSGGAAGSGAGSSPDTPKDPKEADTANPGERVSPPPPVAPVPPTAYSIGALVMQQAAQNGTPFCEICPK